MPRTAQSVEVCESPLDDNFLVVPDPPDESSEAGLHIPGAARAVKMTGTVVACGPLVKEPIFNGVRVRWHFTPSNAIEIDGAAVFVMNRSDIATIIPSEDI